MRNLDVAQFGWRVMIIIRVILNDRDKNVE